jgi:hypothetical protein
LSALSKPDPPFLLPGAKSPTSIANRPQDPAIADKIACPDHIITPQVFRQNVGLPILTALTSRYFLFAILCSMNADQNKLLNELKQAVITRSGNTDFVHHKWFVKYHLEIVEKIAAELCEKYIKADRFKVMVLAWLHDYEKIIDFDNQYNTELVATRHLMQQLGFDSDFIGQMAAELNIYNAKENLSSASLEVQIVSSSDAASHSVGPFMCLYWYENPTKTIEELMASNIRKISVDWDKKITLPEVKEAFAHYRDFNLQVAGQLPEKYLD